MIYQAKFLIKMTPLSSLLYLDWRYWRFDSQRTVWGNKAADSLSPPGMRVGWRERVETYSNLKQWKLPLHIPGILYITYFTLCSAYSIFSSVMGMESYRWLQVTCGCWFHRLVVYFKLSFTGAFLQFHWKASWLLTNPRTQIFHLFICLCGILMLYCKS